MSYASLSHAEKVERLLEVIPQQKPFRYVDDIIHLDEDTVTGTYTFREDEWFYKGHFPGNPITPGVILLECMAQIGIVSLAIHLFLLSNRDPTDRVTFFQSAQVDFLHPVKPGDTVTVRAKKQLFKMGKMKAEVEMLLHNEIVVAKATLVGMGVKK